MINNRPMTCLWQSSDRWSFASVAVFPDQEVRWLYGIQPEVVG
jgi:hypothetical protein